MEARHRRFLTEIGCLEIKHSGRTLFDHLKNVHDLLRDWGNEKHVCDAGLFHSIYGNSAFKHQTLSKDKDRPMLEAMIGNEAELLVYMFNTRKRPMFNDLPKGDVRDNLREIEVANLVEQGGSHKKLHELMRCKISNGAKAAINMEFAS